MTSTTTGVIATCARCGTTESEIEWYWNGWSCLSLESQPLGRLIDPDSVHPRRIKSWDLCPNCASVMPGIFADTQPTQAPEEET